SASGREIPIEPSGDPVCCPVRILDEFLLSDSWDEGDFVFRSSFRGRGKLSSATISALVKKVAEDAGFKGKFSSHSIRIGGATAAVMGGMSMEQIRSIGHW